MELKNLEFQEILREMAENTKKQGAQGKEEIGALWGAQEYKNSASQEREITGQREKWVIKIYGLKRALKRKIGGSKK